MNAIVRLGLLALLVAATSMEVSEGAGAVRAKAESCGG